MIQLTIHTHISFGILVSFLAVTFLFEHPAVLFLFATFSFVSFLLCLGFPFEIKHTFRCRGFHNFSKNLEAVTNI